MKFVLPQFTEQAGFPTPTSVGWRTPYGNTETGIIREFFDSSSYELLVGTTGGQNIGTGNNVLSGNRYRGAFKVSGVLSRDGVPFVGKVLLLERRSLRVVADTVSSPAGAYLFENVMDTEYMILARDGGTLNVRPEFNAAVIDYVRPEPMA